MKQSVTDRNCKCKHIPVEQVEETPEIVKRETSYNISYKGRKITVIIDQDGFITVRPFDGRFTDSRSKFEFTHSDFATFEAMAILFQEALNLIPDIKECNCGENEKCNNC